MNKFNTEIKLDIVNKMNLIVDEPNYFYLDEETNTSHIKDISNENHISLDKRDNDFFALGFLHNDSLKKFLPFLKKQSYFNEYQSITNKILDDINENKSLINVNNYFNKEIIDNLFALNNNASLDVEMIDRTTYLRGGLELVYNINLKSLSFRMEYIIFHDEEYFINTFFINSNNYELKGKYIINNFYKERFFKHIIDKTVDELSEEEKTLIKMSYY